MLVSATSAPTNTANPLNNSVRITSHAIRCGAGVPIACMIAEKASGPFDSFANPCCINPNPTISRKGIGLHFAKLRRPASIRCKTLINTTSVGKQLLRSNCTPQV